MGRAQCLYFGAAAIGQPTDPGGAWIGAGLEGNQVRDSSGLRRFRGRLEGARVHGGSSGPVVSDRP